MEGVDRTPLCFVDPLPWQQLRYGGQAFRDYRSTKYCSRRFMREKWMPVFQVGGSSWARLPELVAAWLRRPLTFVELVIDEIMARINQDKVCVMLITCHSKPET